MQPNQSTKLVWPFKESERHCVCIVSHEVFVNLSRVQLYQKNLIFTLKALPLSLTWCALQLSSQGDLFSFRVAFYCTKIHISTADLNEQMSRDVLFVSADIHWGGRLCNEPQKRLCTTVGLVPYHRDMCFVFSCLKFNCSMLQPTGLPPTSLELLFI